MSYNNSRSVCAHCGKLINTDDQPDSVDEAGSVAVSWHYNIKHAVHPVTYYLCLPCHKELLAWLTTGYNKRRR